MFRMLIHPSSGACDVCAKLFHGLYWSGSMCVGVTLWYGCGGVVSVCRLRHQCLVVLMTVTTISTGKLKSKRTNTTATDITTRGPISEQRPQKIAHVTYLTPINNIIDMSHYIHGTNHSTHCEPSGIPNAHSHTVKNFMVLSLAWRWLFKSKHVALTYAFII